LIVVIVLGILSAVVVPQFSSASYDARRSALATTVQTVRTQIELYKRQHGGALPDLATDWTPFTQSSNFGKATFGPYMQIAPRNHLKNRESAVKNGIAIGNDVSAAFVYDYGTNGDGTGRFWGVDRDPAGKFNLIGD
jgi:general secretion pathway protein G